MAGVITLYDAERCPYCARARIALTEKGIEHEVVAIDLSDRPAWLYEKNPLGKVPVIEEDAFVLPESAVIMEYLDERYPEPPLLPADPAARGLARLRVWRFDDLLGDDYYAYRRGDPHRLEERLAALDLGHQLFVDIAYVPWVIRAKPCSESTCRPTSMSGSSAPRNVHPSPPSSTSLPRSPHEDRTPPRPPLRPADVGDQLPALGEHEVFAPRLYDLGSSIDEWALGVLQQVPGPLVAVGASMGGYTAAGIARLAPERLQGLVLSGSLAGADPPERAPVRERWIQIATERGGEGMWEEVATSFFPSGTDPVVLERAHAIAAEQEPAGLVRAIEAIRDRPDSTEAVASGIPLLVVAGDHDPLVTPEIAHGARLRAPRTGGPRCSKASATSRTWNGRPSSTGS